MLTSTPISRKLLVAVSCSTFLFSCVKDKDMSVLSATDSAVQQDVAVERGADNEYVPNELIIKFKPGTSENARSRALSRVGAKVAEKILTRTMQKLGDKEGIFLIHTPLAVLDAKEKVKGAEIEFAEPNFIYRHDAVADDTYYTNGSLWGMYGDASTPANAFGSQASEAWAVNHTGSAAVHVGVIDEGAMHTHADLSGQIWTNPYDPLDGVDNDDNGYVDDIHGWDFDKNDNSTYDGTTDDHGTHVSGTIGAKGANQTGVVGVNWNISIITVKFLGRRGGTTANAVKAVDYITNVKLKHGINLPATNNSWGGGGFSQALLEAIERANAANILFIAAAGNGGRDGVGDNNDAADYYPANYPNTNVIAVAAITSSGAKSGFSNYGATTVDLGAPGSAIYSTLPGKNNSSAYGSYSGTSMATPHVTGGAALYAASNPGATAAEIKNAILTSTVPTASLSGKCVTGGRLNVSGF